MYKEKLEKKIFSSEKKGQTGEKIYTSFIISTCDTQKGTRSVPVFFPESLEKLIFMLSAKMKKQDLAVSIHDARKTNDYIGF